MPATFTREEALVRFAAIAGDEHAQLAGDAVRVAPANTEQAAEVLRFANQHGLTVVPTGSGSKLGWGNPVAPEIFLSLARMNFVREHAWQDLTCTVQAGCTWAAMQAELARHSQMVALDPLWPDLATVGGVVATNDSGALRLRYGGLRDLIIGMTLVLADGTIAKTGGKVVKNVAGYDLHKLLTGSFGTLGVIAEVNFRLHPIEQHARTLTFAAPSAPSLAQPLRNLLHAQMALSSAQLRIAEKQCALDVRIVTRPECLEQHAAHLRSIFSPLADADASEAVWQSRQQLFSSPNAVIARVSLLPDDVCAAAAEWQQTCAAQGVEVSLVAQATGLMTIALSGPSGAIIGIIDQFRTRLRPSGGSVVLLQIPDDLRGKIDVWDCRSDALPLMREIKRRFDPHAILNPGRFVGGI